MNHALKKRKQPSGERLFPGEGEGMSKVREGRMIMIQWDTRQVIRCGWRGRPKLRNAAAGRTEADKVIYQDGGFVRYADSVGYRDRVVSKM